MKTIRKKQGITRQDAVLHADERMTITRDELIFWTCSDERLVVTQAEEKEFTDWTGKIYLDRQASVTIEVFAPSIHAYHAIRASFFLGRRGRATPMFRKLKGITDVVAFLEKIGEIK